MNAFIPGLSCINLNNETSSLFITGCPYDIRKTSDFSNVRTCGKLCVNFYSVVIKDTSCTIRLLAKAEVPARASNKTGHNIQLFGVRYLIYLARRADIGRSVC